MLKKTTRKAMEDLVYSVFSKLDPTGENTKKFKNLYSKMNDKEFENYVLDMLNNHRMFHVLDVSAFHYEPTMDNADAAAKVLGIGLYEYVAFPHMSEDPNHPFITPRPVPVGYEHIKRLQQMKRKKNSTTTRIDERDMKTNQVTGHDKAARTSDMENYAMAAYGANEAMREFMSFRADDNVMKSEAYAKIYKDGYVDMNELHDDPYNKKTLNTLNTYLLSMGLLSDLITPGYVLKDVLDKKDK